MEDQEKRELKIRLVDDRVLVDLIKRTIKTEDIKIPLYCVTLDMGKIHAPDWLITAGANLTWIRFQDNARRTMTVAEIEDIAGRVFDAAQFWADRAERKPRKPIAVKPETVAKGFERMTDEDQAKLVELLAANPKFADILKNL